MSGVNKVILIGHLGKDPEIRGTSSGGVVASFSLATSETWKDKTTGERKEATEWHSVVVFNEVLVKLAENHLRKGAKVYVEGALKTRKWQDKDGKDRWTTEIVLQNFRGEIQMLDRIEGNRPPPAESTEDYGKVSGRSDGMANASAIVRAPIDDEIPF